MYSIIIKVLKNKFNEFLPPQASPFSFQVSFEDVIGEPEGAHSIDCVWRNSYKCYNFGIGCCYKMMTTLCGLCIALYWGCVFACISFDHVWCITPNCRVLDLNCAVLNKLIAVVLKMINPICDVCCACRCRPAISVGAPTE